MVIADFGSGNTCKNDVAYVRRMIDELAAVDPGRKATIKWQLFKPESAPHCIRLEPAVFESAYRIAHGFGYKTTASVFDSASLGLLLTYDVPFVKIAAREWCYPLIDLVPRGVPVVVSVVNMRDAIKYTIAENVRVMCCVPEYPAAAETYEELFTPEMLHRGISDHTSNLDLWRKYKPETYERHYKLPDSTGADAGPFASTPEEWAEVLT